MRVSSLPSVRLLAEPQTSGSAASGDGSWISAIRSFNTHPATVPMASPAEVATMTCADSGLAGRGTMIVSDRVTIAPPYTVGTPLHPVKVTSTKPGLSRLMTDSGSST